MASLLPRYAARLIDTALHDTPAVLLVGPRQCGKTTLAKTYATPNRPYFTLDDETTLAAARSDPRQFMRGLDGAVIDEVQRAPELLRTLKLLVDESRQPGRFLLTGSADLLMLPQVADSLAGRIEVVTLLPLSQSEIRRSEPRFLDEAFEGRLVAAAAELGADALVDAVLIGGYPEMRQRKEPARRRAWARGYLNAIIQRDVRDIANVARLDVMPRLLRSLAAHAAQLANFSQLGAPLGLDDKTTRRYVGLLEQLFLVRRLEPWSRNELKRLVKTPKLHFIDSGLLAALRGITADRVARDRGPFGPLLETYVFAEVLKQAGWSDEPARASYYRTRDGEEVDIVLERDDGAVVAIEVKAAASVSTASFKGLQQFAAACGDDLRLGVLLHDGPVAVPFGERLWAAPMSCLFGVARVANAPQERPGRRGAQRART